MRIDRDVRPRRIAAALTVMAVLTAGAAAQAPAWRVDAGEVTVVCPLTIGGSFEAKTRSLAGRLSESSSNPDALDGTLRVDLATLDTGIGLRNSHLRDRYLEVRRGEGFTHAVLSDIVLGAAVRTAAGRTRFTGSLTVHGVSRPVEGTAVLTPAGGAMRVEATFPVRLPDHEIPKPRYLGVGVEDDVRVTVTFTAADAREDRQPEER
jgi:polyisoprenoid-binding protein YceI